MTSTDESGGAALAQTTKTSRSRRSWYGEELRHLDPGTSAAFVDQFYGRVFSFFCLLVGNADSAADLTQDTFAAFWQSLARTRVRDPQPWLFQVARNRWRKHCRDQRGRRAAPLSDGEAPDCSAGPAQQIAAAERSGQVLKALRRLGPAYGEAVTLRYWSDLSYREIGKIQGVPELLARWRVHRAKKLLRAWLSGTSLYEEGGDSDG